MKSETDLIMQPRNRKKKYFFVTLYRLFNSSEKITGDRNFRETQVDLICKGAMRENVRASGE